MGQLLETERFSYKVTGVYEDITVTSHMRPDAMSSFSTNEQYANSQSWGGFGLYTYVVLNDGVDPAYVEQRLNEEIIPKYVATVFDQFDIKVKYEMINIQDIHLHSTFQNEPSALGNIDYIYIFLAVAIFLVLIACINYMNLAHRPIHAQVIGSWNKESDGSSARGVDSSVYCGVDSDCIGLYVHQHFAFAHCCSNDQ